MWSFPFCTLIILSFPVCEVSVVPSAPCSQNIDLCKRWQNLKLPLSSLRRHTGGVDIYLQSFLTSAADGGELSASPCSPLCPGRSPCHPLNRRFPLPHSQSGHFAENKVLVLFQESNPGSSDPQTSDYTYWAVLAPLPICVPPLMWDTKIHMHVKEQLYVLMFTFLGSRLELEASVP